MKSMIRKWLGLKDTHHMECSDLRIFGELLNVSDPCSISEGDLIDVAGKKYRVTGHVIAVKPQ